MTCGRPLRPADAALMRAESAGFHAKSAKKGVTLCNCQLRRGGTEWMIRAATRVTDVAINLAEVGARSRGGWGLATAHLPCHGLCSETEHDAVSIGLAALDGTVSSRWPVTVPRSARGCSGAGFAVGALVAGMAADLPGLAAATWLVAGLTGTPGLILAARTHETQRRGRTGRRCRATPRP